MRFRFCGDLDCPDWVLAEISTLSRISSVKMKLLCQQVITGLLGTQIDYTKVEKFTADAKYNANDIKAAIAALDCIFTNAAKYNVDGEILSSELQQLGLPKELAMSLCKVYDSKHDQLRSHLKNKSMRLSHFVQVNWRVDYVLSTSGDPLCEQPEVQLQIEKSSSNAANEIISFACSDDKFISLLADLKQALNLMEEVSS